MVRGRPNPRHITLPTRLRRARRAAKLSRAGLSRAAGIGPYTVAAIEAGLRLPRLPVAERIADALHVSPGFLAYGLNAPYEPRPTDVLRCEGLPARVRAARDLRGYSLREAGRRLGRSAAIVQLLERGTMPTLDTLEDVANALGVSPSWLAFGEGPQELPKRRQLINASTGANHASPQAYVSEKPQHDQP